MRLRSLVLLLLLLPSGAWGTDWVVDPAASRLGFVARWEGEAFEGVFRRWTATMRFQSNDLAASGFDVAVDMSSADTHSAERDVELRKPEWFAAGRFPEARFVTTAIRRRAAGGYEAVGKLTMKGATQPLVLPFTWSEAAGQAHMQGEVSIDRRRWNVGEGEWSSGDVIQHQVRVVVDVHLTRR